MSRVVVYHSTYGCDTGCCGHYVEIDGVDRPNTFEFSHPFVPASVKGPEREEALKEWAREFITDALGPEHVADIDWDNCLVVDD